jgi:hypothetical protein
LLKIFEDSEVIPDDFAEVSLESPVLLILAQHRSFRICRRKSFAWKTIVENEKRSRY